MNWTAAHASKWRWATWIVTFPMMVVGGIAFVSGLLVIQLAILISQGRHESLAWVADWVFEAASRNGGDE